ncbi:membrane protein insertion efficiency factor YidD [Agromyces archimandritae]|uniref:Putative membrane protein insertion efficiency factor n=1 Tax=Agromyces archimandritae TaxID=2781962 RepID=A0A975FPA0_9MICO|nr:membrane protein insertion efficiency factor YidD [Agromyces archimandritae]QTX06060.1 membrane protein insertion efficiency factor YidD [Agromyces archimandritae]
MPAFVAVVLLLPRNLVIAVLIAYRKVISPLYGDVCRYYPSCSAYGLGSVQQRGVVIGAALAVWRILRCNPWASGGIDEVRSPARFRYRITRAGFVAPSRGVDAAAASTPGSHAGHAHASDVRATSSALAPALSRKD